MHRALLTSSGPLRRLSLLECTPCVVAHCARHRRLQRTQAPSPPLWTEVTAEYAVDAAVGAVLLGGAAEVLVPASLVHFLEHPSRRVDTSGQRPTAAWDALLRDGRVVVLVGSRDVDELVERFPAYTKLCVPVPGGPLAAKMFFGVTETAFFAEEVPRTVRRVERARAQGHNVQWRAWLRSSLTCLYEGTHVAPIRVAEHTASLIKDEGGCSHVILEAGVEGLRPRWLETMVKTALSCGVPTATLALALCESPNAAVLLAKAVEMGVSQFATTSLSLPTESEGSPCDQPRLFDGAQPLIGVDTAVTFAVGWSETSARGSITADEEALLQSSRDYVDALTDEWQSLRREV